MSIALIVTRGYGNGTLTGTIKDVVIRGYTIGAAEVGFVEVGLNSIVSSRDLGLTSTLTSNGIGVNSTIVSTKGVLSIVSSRDLGLTSTITSDGVGVGSEL